MNLIQWSVHNKCSWKHPSRVVSNLPSANSFSMPLAWHLLWLTAAAPGLQATAVLIEAAASRKPGSIWGDAAGDGCKWALGEPGSQWACAANGHKGEKSASASKLWQKGKGRLVPSSTCLLSLEDLLSVQLMQDPCLEHALHKLSGGDSCLYMCLCSSNCKETTSVGTQRYCVMRCKHVLFQLSRGSLS